jgi:hypothetical protein
MLETVGGQYNICWLRATYWACSAIINDSTVGVKLGMFFQETSHRKLL